MFYISLINIKYKKIINITLWLLFKIETIWFNVRCCFVFLLKKENNSWSKSKHSRVSECLTPIQQFFSIFSAIWRREQVNFQWDDDEVHLLLDQHTGLDFYSASLLKQQSASRHVYRPHSRQGHNHYATDAVEAFNILNG